MSNTRTLYRGALSAHLEQFLLGSFGQSLPGVAWYGQMSRIKPLRFDSAMTLLAVSVVVSSRAPIFSLPGK
ncbi:MAG: hypothetical protein KUG83_07775 [Gammaproteobacteria bacterium]|nr:hypothetical protein [Gammaproteobacteria bacterium]